MELTSRAKKIKRKDLKIKKLLFRLQIKTFKLEVIMLSNIYQETTYIMKKTIKTTAIFTFRVVFIMNHYGFLILTYDKFIILIYQNYQKFYIF
jgi:hypothetical protein